MKNLFFIIFLIGVFVGDSTFAEDGACLKKVFNTFCLGGPAKDLPPLNVQQPEEFMAKWQRKLGKEVTAKIPLYDDDFASFLYEGRRGHSILVGLNYARIISVNKYYDFHWSKYLELREKLEKKYGKPSDSSGFPLNSKTPESEVRLTWYQEGWRIGFDWDDRGELTYSVNDIFNEMYKPDEGL